MFACLAKAIQRFLGSGCWVHLLVVQQHMGEPRCTLLGIIVKAVLCVVLVDQDFSCVLGLTQQCTAELHSCALSEGGVVFFPCSKGKLVVQRCTMLCMSSLKVRVDLYPHLARHGMCAEPIVTVRSSAAWTWTRSNMDNVVCVWLKAAMGWCTVLRCVHNCNHTLLPRSYAVADSFSTLLALLRSTNCSSMAAYLAYADFTV